MTYNECTEWMFVRFPEYQQVGDRAFKPGLGTTLALDDHLGNPSRAFKVVHVAGTNGKGSVSHSIASVLQSVGYIVGLYTSPHLKDFRERIRVDGCPIPEDEVVKFVDEHKEFLEKQNASFFEITTIMAFAYFKHVGVDVAVVETGLGGRLDSTNIVWPTLSVITNIGLEHTKYLGNTLSDIAKEKAGIIKEERPVVIGERHVETDPVFEDMAGIEEAPIYFAEDEYSVENKVMNVMGSEFQLVTKPGGKLRNVGFDLGGYCQEKNIVTILSAIDKLVLLGFEDITEEAVDEGLRNVKEQTGLMGRWQMIESKPDVIVDTAHNMHGIRLVSEQLRDTGKQYSHVHVVFGMANDKQPEKVLAMLPKENCTYYFCEANTQRAVAQGDLVKMAKGMGLTCGDLQTNVKSVADVFEAVKKNAEVNDLIFIGGSNFVVAEVL